MTGLRYFAIGLRSPTFAAPREGSTQSREERHGQRPAATPILPLERVVFGRPAAEAVVEETARIGAARVFMVASKSLARNTPVIRAIADALGSRYAGLFDGCVQHSPRASVIAAAQAVRAAAPDLILTVGGGTAIDTVKVLQICLAHGVETTEGLDGLHVSDRAATANGTCRTSSPRRCARWWCRRRCPAPNSPTLPASPTSASARSIPSSVPMSARVPSSSTRR